MVLTPGECDEIIVCSIADAGHQHLYPVDSEVNQFPRANAERLHNFLYGGPYYWLVSSVCLSVQLSISLSVPFWPSNVEIFLPRACITMAPFSGRRSDFRFDETNNWQVCSKHVEMGLKVWLWDLAQNSCTAKLVIGFPKFEKLCCEELTTWCDSKAQPQGGMCILAAIPPQIMFILLIHNAIHIHLGLAILAA